MLNALLNRQIDRFERTWSYDASYLRIMLRANLGSFLRFLLISGLADRKAAPAEALAAVGIAAILAEDCGACTQLAADMAAAGGVKPQVLAAILAGDEAGMGHSAALTYRFARASLARDVAAADPLRDEIVRLWGEKGLTALALSLARSRMFPTIKYAMGHGRTCSRITVAGSPVVVAAQAA